MKNTPVATDDGMVMPRRKVKAIIKSLRFGRPLVWEEFCIGTVPSAATLNRRGDRVAARGYAGDIHKRYVLWTKAEGHTYAEMTSATGLSHDTCQRVVMAARADARRFAHCQFVVPIGPEWSIKGYLCRYCGSIYAIESKANQCAWEHCFGQDAMPRRRSRRSAALLHGD
ncbi:MAG: hypothetical protein HY678_09080 [Chloroflexi bacterium]|nr:hypothetical protein [Chloroflexota bacterium]